MKVLFLLWQAFVIKILLPVYTCAYTSPQIIFNLWMKNYDRVGVLIQEWSLSCFWWVRKKYEVVGLENIDKDKRYIIISNHGSIFDIPLTGVLFNTPISWVMKDSLLKLPIANYMFLLGVGIPIPRTNPKASQQKMLEKIVLLKERMNPNIIIYPEGTRTKTGELAKFKRGFIQMAKNYQMDILPITICGAYNFYSKTKFWSNPDSKIKVIIHPVVSYDSIKDRDEKVVAQEMQTLITQDYYA